MTGLLFAFAFWLVIAVAAFGAVVWITLVTFAAQDFLEERNWVKEERRAAHLLAATVPPYDWDDPMEKWFLLPDAPDPKWLVG